MGCPWCKYIIHSLIMFWAYYVHFTNSLPFHCKVTVSLHREFFS
jgi:hypothetical protein